MSSGGNAMALNAAVLGASGVQSLDVNRAMNKVRAALSRKSTASRDVYAVLIYGKHQHPNEFDTLTTVNTVLKAYWKGWRSLSRLNVSPSLKPDDLRKTRIPGSSDLHIYWGSADAKDVKEKMSAVPGVYVILSHPNASLFGSMGLPPLPQPFRELPVVIQLKTTDHSPNRRQGSEAPAIASRWKAEGKIFSVRFEGKTWFPRFQFQDGRPIPAVAAVIKAFPKHSTGWDLAFFFTNPNSYIEGRKPIEILKSDPERVKSLAQAFVNPADVF
jgi:hypothetical protein